METAIFSLVGVIVGSVLAMAKELIFSVINNRADKRYLIVRVSCILESFAHKCMDVSYDEGFEVTKGRMSENVDTPELELSDIDVNWKSISASTVHEILSLQIIKEEIDMYTASVWEHQDHMDYFKARQKKYTELGLKAIELCHKLKKEVGIPDTESLIDFDLAESLRSRVEQLA